MIVLLPDSNVVEAIHAVVIEEFGGSPGVLKHKAIKSLVARPMHYITYAECDLNYICAILLQGIASSHAFVDGNKRTAVFTCVYTYATNEVVLDGSTELNNKLENLVLQSVTEKPSVEEIAATLKSIVDQHGLGFMGRTREKIDDFFS